MSKAIRVLAILVMGCMGVAAGQQAHRFEFPDTGRCFVIGPGA